MTFAVTDQYPIFADTDGTPLNNGYIYIGEADQNPVTNPISVYWDEDLQYPAGQPVRTLAGAPNRNGSPGQLYCNVSFSILINNENGEKVYYSKNGIKNYTDSSFGDFTNYVPNGRFEVAQRQFVNYDYFTPDRWNKDESTYSTTITRNGAVSDYVVNLEFAGVPAAGNGDYSRFYCIIENAVNLVNHKITLSWEDAATGSSVTFEYAISLTYISNVDPTYNITGIGVQKFTAGTTLTRREIMIDLPEPDTYAYVDLAISFWLTAGSDYDGQTDSLGNKTAVGTYDLNIADVRLNKSSIFIDTDNKTFAEELKDAERYYEQSYAYFDGFSGYITYIASSATTTIPGIRFLTEKRTSSPTVNVYSTDSDDVDKIYLVGVGDIAVSSYNAVSSSGVGSMTLAVPTVAGGVYQYHYIAKDELTI